jgi:Rrf2 family protein
MRSDSRLSGILHVLLHMAERPEPVTSEALAAHMGANPVQVRRIMAGLREAGFVHSGKGHGGGWTIGRDLAALTMRDVYAAIGSPTLFAIGNRSENPGCMVEQAVNAALDDTLRQAEAQILDRLAEISLADLSADFRRRAVEAGPRKPGKHGQR